MKIDIEANKLPQPLIWVFLCICVFPMILTLIGVDSGTNKNTLTFNNLGALENINLADFVHISHADSFAHIAILNAINLLT